jgi:hypothetical protein
MDKPHIFSEATERGFCKLKSQLPLDSKIKYPQLIARKDLSIDIILDPC